LNSCLSASTKTLADWLTGRNAIYQLASMTIGARLRSLTLKPALLGSNTVRE
jgi:hypothetical protein